MNKNIDQQQVLGFALALAFWWLLLGSVQLAVGLLLLVFIHEMGHVMAARSRGIAVSMPTFTPFGAYVQTGATSSISEEAFTKMAGPLVGGLAALLTLAAGYVVGSPLLVQVGTLGVFLNLFNLIPLDPFDGGGIAQVFGRWTVVPGVVAFGYFFLTLGGLSGYNLLFAAFFGFQAWQAYQQRTSQWQLAPRYFSTTPATKVKVALTYLAVGGTLAWVLLNPGFIPSLLTSVGL
ncbi:MAG: site-2 protease family protein [Cyanobacteria bacterium SZAS LIN-3]|nr:site-2 protease family protein [Cyanobacteria bacterium SZAS LIN-3]MBS2007345.1 site-2 protease family protein [Cyanobacteria bacterium SZAS TMP-1]